MTQSNLNQAVARAIYKAQETNPLVLRYEDLNQGQLDYLDLQAKSAIAAYLECVDSNYDAELLVNGVTGVIFNDKAKRFEDDEMICTSSVVSGFIQTKNTRYKLISTPPTSGDSR